MGFPQLSNISKEIVDTINSRAGNNQKVSGMIPWMRVISTLGDFLAIETESRTVSFAEKYGDSTRSGKVGTDRYGNVVYAEEGDRAFRPSPTISELQLKQGNEGLSKKVTFTITAYTVKQAELLMQHFLEPGKMVLVEWGENSSQSVSQKISDLTNTCDFVAYNNLEFIQKKRAQSNGTYDAMLGTIVGGGTQFGDNETYSIEVELMSIGELPAYLQHHKNIASDNPDVSNSSKTFDLREINQAADDGEDIGTALFMQMFNELPEHKRNADVKALRDEPWAIDPINFINIDKEIKEDLVKGLSGIGRSVKIDGEKVKVPSDTPLFSEKRFIRCALAFTILDLQPDTNIVESAIENECPKAKRSPALVSWQNTACRAHKHMFSANTDILYIPNKQAPKFDLKAALVPIKDSDGNTKALQSPIETLQSLNTAAGIADIHPGEEGSIKYSYFPNENPISFKDQATYDDTYLPIEADAYRWGWLKDLYINFDFFCDVLRSSGLITRDVWYKILNGMSSAVNLYWNFQLVPRGCVDPYLDGSNATDTYFKEWAKKQKSETGDELLQIVDASFVGKFPDGAGKAKFQSRGTRTPFLSATFDMNIPGAMKGSVIGAGLSTSVKNPNAESKEIDWSGLFSNKKDEVKEKLNSINNKVSENEKSEEDLRREKLKKQGLTDAQINIKLTKEKNKAKDEENKEQAKQNYEFFAQTACVVPAMQDRTKGRDILQEWYDVLDLAGNDAPIDSIAIVGGWNDTTLLKTVQKFDDGYILPEEGDLRPQENLPLLPIKFNFTIHGVSGIRVGDTFCIPDLPLKYGKYVFQVVQVEQTISQNIWTTSVSGQIRMMEASSDTPAPYKGK